MKEQLQFAIQVLNARLSDQTPTSEQHGRGAACVKAHDRFAAQNTRPRHKPYPRPISPPCGECAGVALRETSKPETKTGATEVMFHADMGSLFRFRCVSWNGRMLLPDLLASLPVHPSHQVNTVAVFRIVCG
jgi:hypothetical protein